MFFFQFLVNILPLDPDPWIRIFADPDPGRQNLADPTDPDPKHRFNLYKRAKYKH